MAAIRNALEWRIFGGLGLFTAFLGVLLILDSFGE